MRECNSRTEHKACEARVLDEYGHIRRIREIITDHGAQFYANKRDKNGNAEHSFEQYLKSEGVKHILCRITTIPNLMVRLSAGSKNTRNTGWTFPLLKTSYVGIITGRMEAMTCKLLKKYSGKEHKHTYSEDSSNGQSKTKTNFLPDTTLDLIDHKKYDKKFGYKKS